MISGLCVRTPLRVFPILSPSEIARHIPVPGRRRTSVLDDEFPCDAREDLQSQTAQDTRSRGRDVSVSSFSLLHNFC